jgi:hypothetical protein
MPVVTINPEQFERFDLKSAEGAYVCLRPLPYGMKLARRSKAVRTMMRSKPVQSRKEALEQDQVFELSTEDEWAAAHDFAYCIGDHNLESAPGQLIDFARNTLFVIKMLDPRVGSEIEQLIDKLNNAEDEETFEDFLKQQATLSEVGPTELDLVGKEHTTD